MYYTFLYLEKTSSVRFVKKEGKIFAHTTFEIAEGIPLSEDWKEACDKVTKLREEQFEEKYGKLLKIQKGYYCVPIKFKEVLKLSNK